MHLRSNAELSAFLAAIYLMNMQLQSSQIAETNCRLQVLFGNLCYRTRVSNAVSKWIPTELNCALPRTLSSGGVDHQSASTRNCRPIVGRLNRCTLYLECELLDASCSDMRIIPSSLISSCQEM